MTKENQRTASGSVLSCLFQSEPSSRKQEGDDQESIVSIELPPHGVGMRLDQFLAQHLPQVSRTSIQKIIELGSVYVNGDPQKKRYILSKGDQVVVDFPMPEPWELKPEPIPLQIIYEDAYFLAVNKQPGLVVHPAPGNWNGTFVQGLLHYLGSIEHSDPIRPGIIHRLDKDTSGVLLAAKTGHIHRMIANQFAERSVEKRYLAIVKGKIEKSLFIDAPLQRDLSDRRKMVVRATGKVAQTELLPLEVLGGCTLVELRLITGRTHQIRAHLKHVGYPLLGDSLYGVLHPNACRQMLHCCKISFSHPETKEQVTIEAPIPDDMAFLLNEFR